MIISSVAPQAIIYALFLCLGLKWLICLPLVPFRHVGTHMSVRNGTRLHKLDPHVQVTDSTYCFRAERYHWPPSPRLFC